MKKALLYGLSAVMLLSLTACGTAKAEQPDEPDPKHTTSAVQTEPPQESAVPSDKSDNVVEPLSANGSVTTRAPTQEELSGFYERAYLSGDEFRGVLPDADIIDIELIELSFIVSVENADLIAPENMEDSYRAWRAEVHPAAPVPASTQTPAPAEAKPSTGGQQSKPAGGGTTQPGGTQQTGGGTYTPPAGQAGNPAWDPDSLFTDPYKGLTPEERAAQDQRDREATQRAVDGTTSRLYPGGAHP